MSIVHKAKRSEIPSDAIILNEKEALKLQVDVVQNWEPKKDTWIFRHGFTILSGMTALTSLYINSHYRLKFRLRSHGRISTYLPIVVIPSMLSSMFHNQFVTHDVFLQKSCPVCIQIRSGASQAVTSTIIPTIMAPLSAIPLAIRYFTYDVPMITKEPMKVFNMLYKITKPIGNNLMGLLLLNFIVGGLIGSYEMKSFINIQMKVNKLENEFESQQPSFQ